MASHMLITVFRTVMVYFVIYLTLRIMGKREIGKLSIFDLVISIMTAEIGVFVLEDSHRPFYDAIIPVATLIIIQLSTAYISLKSRKIRLLFEGKPSILVSSGKLQRDEMKKQRYNLDDLLQQMRANNVHNIADVEFAILENTGQLTVIPKSQTDPRQPGMGHGRKTPSNMSSAGVSKKKILAPAGSVSYATLPVSLIMDGEVLDDNLHRLKKNRFWLKNQIQQQGVKEFKDVFLCSIDHKGRVFVDRK
ncbi:DUF421 domain-containing protein [Paenibacillus sp.]|jgi:uncharacterized membrane protein YcaP (DUF421 family)|uniref:DUF421 domain-containing protein n=1 Tax=Paenibacillus sp. TaxID=58172 RepID=UPI0028343641|nr:DUF421 domain-containing protein [Paenibacillus sp.]MDR0266788.1 DUF421 domain-containing protein [Paenibacillus sp.]